MRCLSSNRKIIGYSDHAQPVDSACRKSRPHQGVRRKRRTPENGKAILGGVDFFDNLIIYRLPFARLLFLQVYNK